MKENRNLKEYTMKKRILYNPLTDEFATLGDKFEKIAHNKVNGMYCYKQNIGGSTPPMPNPKS